MIFLYFCMICFVHHGYIIIQFSARIFNKIFCQADFPLYPINQKTCWVQLWIRTCENVGLKLPGFRAPASNQEKLEVGDMNDRGSARRRYTLWQAGWSPGQSQTQVILLLTLILKLLFCCSMVTWSEFWSNTESSKGTKGRALLPNRVIFWETNPNGLWPPPSFWKLISKFVSKNPCLKPCTKVQNLQFKFLDKKWPPPPLWNFSENSSDLVVWPVPMRHHWVYRF